MNKTFERRLLRLTSGLLLVLFITATLVYWVSFRSTYYAQVEQSNHGLVEQIGLSFEALLKQISNQIYRIPLYDRDLLALVRQKTKDPLFPLDVVRKLDSLNIGNDYINYSSLYILSSGLVFSTETNSVRPLAESPDREQILTARQGVITVSPPRVVTSQSTKKLLLSFVCPIPLYTATPDAMLVVNIDAQYLYLDILKKAKIGPNMRFQVSDGQNRIVFRRDDRTLFDMIGTRPAPTTKPDPWGWVARLTALEDTVTSTYYSQALDWSFSLQTTVRASSVLWERLYLVLVSLIVLLVVGWLVLLLIIRRSTQPISTAYHRTVWADFLSGVPRDGGGEPSERRLRQELDIEDLPDTRFQLILVHQDAGRDGVASFSEALANRLERERLRFSFHVVAIGGDQTVVVLQWGRTKGGSDTGQALREPVREALDELPTADQGRVFISISREVDHFADLRAAYRDCVLALDHRLMATDPIVELSGQTGTAGTAFHYPQEIEGQILNTLLAGLGDRCGLLAGQFFDQFPAAHPALGDGEIRAHCFRLQAAISSRTSLYGLSNPDELACAVTQARTLAELSARFVGWLEQAAGEITLRLHTHDSVQAQQISDYIGANFSDHNFNLNSAADALGMNRNTLARLVKNQYGKGFNEVTAQLRLRRAKVLLLETQQSVEQIAHGLGYTYANYFIRIFKSIEGLTPGQYRERLIQPLTERD